ncbi:MAG TPA: glycosyltransferase family 2 protein [Terriglobales bacterium]|nr:glycosyltransferase family 2 protein [Terriglobales bacterium]
MPSAKLSVVIPTHNRIAILQKTLAAYLDQTARNDILEILVIDDGSTDETSQVVPRLATSSAVPIRYLRQENSGPAAARNRGIREAQGEVVLFGDDDIIPVSRLVAEHLSWHARYTDPAIGVVGPAYWSPELPPTPLMRWWGLNGVRFEFPHMKVGQRLSWITGNFWNTSVKIRFLRENGGFDERFRYPMFEDSELSYRLATKGYQALFNPDAIGHHYKKVTFSDMCRYRRIVATTPALEVYCETEAGRYRNQALALRRKKWIYRVQKCLTRIVVPLLSPLKPLLDSPVPLPGILYSAFLGYYGSLQAVRENRVPSLSRPNRAGG